MNQYPKYFFVIFVCFFLIFIEQNWEYLIIEANLIKFVYLPNSIIFSISIAVLLCGSVVRTLRTKVLMDRAQAGKFWPEYKIFTIGIATNIITPFRIGDIVRSFLYSRYLRISWAYSLAVIVFEICLDLFLLSSVLLVASSSVDSFPSEIRIIALLSAVLSLILVVSFGLLTSGNSLLMKFLLFVSEPLSDKYKFRFRHSSWASIHAFQKFLKSPRAILKYLMYTIFSWVLYILSATLVFKFVYGVNVYNDAIYLTPFLTLSTLLGAQNIESFSVGLRNTIEYFTIEPQNFSLSNEGSVAIWQTLNLPFLILGTIFAIISIFNFPVIQRADWKTFSNLSRLNSNQTTLTLFVDSYFHKDALAMAIHAEDVRGDYQVLGYFKGGSGAVTALVSKNETLLVRKTVAKQNQASLRKQYRWLLQNKNNPLIVKALDSNLTKTSFSYNLEYVENSIPAFEYIHSNSFEQNSKLVRTILNNCNNHIYSLTGKSYSADEIRNYFQTHLMQRVNLAANSYEILEKVLRSNHIVINGRKYDNFFMIFERIISSEGIINELSSIRQSKQIHGDLTIDNILVNTVDGSPVIIDPSDDNPICSPVLDYSRLLQSLLGGYEFINQETTPPNISWNKDFSCPEIRFTELRSEKYSELAQFVLKESEKSLTFSENHALTFHVGLFFGRMLTHRVRINPKTSIIYLSKSIEYLNEYVNNFEKRNR